MKRIEFAATVRTFEGVSFNTTVRAKDKEDAKGLLLAQGFYSVFIW